MEQLNAFWFQGFKNFGDQLVPLVLNFLTGLQIKSCNSDIKDCVVSIGSVLGNGNRIYPSYNIWGSGCMFTYEKSAKSIYNVKNVFAVRGPKTREVLQKAGINCPAIYGDPGIFSPLIYKDIVKSGIYQYGIILHFNDLNKLNILKSIFANKSVLFIRLDQNVKDVLKQICQCKIIISSALHGIIAAEAYNIPAVWLEISDRVEGNGFKFYDYFLGSGRTMEDIKPLNWRQYVSLNNLPIIPKPKYNIKELLDSAPFKILPQAKESCLNYFKSLNS